MTTYWRNRRVLVTGADGFIGSHLVEALIHRGASVLALIRGTSTSADGTYQLDRLCAQSVERLEQVIAGDIAGPDIIRQIVDSQPDTIFHLAAAAWVPYSFQHPVEVARTNVFGTLNVLEAARQLAHLSRVVCTSSSEIYGTAQTGRIAESHALNPTSPYAASKLAADRFAHAYGATYGIPVAIIRPFNTYGPRHTYDVVPKFIRLALCGTPLPVYGDGTQQRDLLYVEDTVDAFLLMGSHEAAVGRSVNFGTGRSHSIRFVASEIIRIAGGTSTIEFGAKRAAEVERLCCDPSLAADLFGWRARVELEDGLRRNIDWVKAHAR